MINLNGKSNASNVPNTRCLIFMHSSSLMASYDDDSLERIPPALPLGDKEHVLIVQDETVFHTNEYRRRGWFADDQQPIRKKGGGRAIHVSDFICETIGRIKLSEEQICEQLELSPEHRLATFEARKIIYPGKGFDAWWDLKQLIEQVRITISIFEYTHPSCIGIFVFDRSSAHEGFAEDALNVNSMNLHPGGKQKRLRNTIIPLKNPDPVSSEEDTRGKVQYMCFPEDHEDPQLRGEPKGIKAVLEERTSVWSEYRRICRERGAKELKKCTQCTKSQVRKDAERRIAKAEEMEQQGDIPSPEDIKLEAEVPPTIEDEWCCMYRVLSLQEDFQSEKPIIQSMIEEAGHVCLFLPRFHCELNAIELLWGYAKNRASISCTSCAAHLSQCPGFRTSADGRFTTAKLLVPECLDACPLTTIRRFFRKTWRYMDAYRYVHKGPCTPKSLR